MITIKELVYLDKSKYRFHKLDLEDVLSSINNCNYTLNTEFKMRFLSSIGTCIEYYDDDIQIFPGIIVLKVEKDKKVSVETDIEFDALRSILPDLIKNIYARNIEIDLKVLEYYSCSKHELDKFNKLVGFTFNKRNIPDSTVIKLIQQGVTEFKILYDRSTVYCTSIDNANILNSSRLSEFLRLIKLPSQNPPKP